MDLKSFDFPKVTGADAVFSTFDTDKQLLQEAKDRGFYCGHTTYNDLFSKLFFIGGKPQFRPDVDKEYIDKVWSYCRAFMRSFAPKHEEKEAICAMLMSEILEPKFIETQK